MLFDPACNVLTCIVLIEVFCAVLHCTDKHRTSAEEEVCVFPTNNVNDVVHNDAVSYRSVPYLTASKNAYIRGVQKCEKRHNVLL